MADSSLIRGSLEVCNRIFDRKALVRTMIDRYVRIYLKQIIQLALVCATIVSVPLFVVSIFYDVVPEDIFVSFTPYVIAAAWIAVAPLYTKRFRKMIHAQERLYDVQFRDTDAVHLETSLYLSKDWLIRAGSCAVYRAHVQSINAALRHGRAGSAYEVTIKTVDQKKYRIWCANSSNVRKIKKWNSK